MVQSKITYYAMLKPERCYEIRQEVWARQVARAARITVRLPSDSREPEEEEQPGKEKEEEIAPTEVEKPEEPDQQVPAFNWEQAEAEFTVAQSDEIVEQQAILESIQDEAYVEANRTFLRREQAESDAFFAELDAKIEAEEAEGAGAAVAKIEAEEAEGAGAAVATMLPEPGTEIVVISDEE